MLGTFNIFIINCNEYTSYKQTYLKVYIFVSLYSMIRCVEKVTKVARKYMIAILQYI